ncbi:hypothetical protein [Candidatus Trichorickettsia mobilis]|uniref:hypothetical protein n=1 Tax=Candidatus Trichorickettsia mobilis TaxID=1346319 RepID=UPI00292CDB11|nr:hypothetical protein [Candidatus Trichorickettsia mobilis]
MSLFVGLLAFPDSATQSLAKIGVIVESLSSVVLAILFNTIEKYVFFDYLIQISIKVITLSHYISARHLLLVFSLEIL